MHRGDITRERLLKETDSLVRRRGFSRTSVSTLLQATGVKKGALYHHFPGKDDLGLAVLARNRCEFLAFLDKNLDSATPLESLDRFFAAALAKHRNTGFVGGCLWGNTALEMGDSDVPHVDLVKQMFEDWIAKVECVIQSGQEAGEIRADLPAVDLARLVVAGIEGGIMLSRLTKQEGPLKTCLESLRFLLSQPGNVRDLKPTIRLARRRHAQGATQPLEHQHGRN